MEQAEAVMDLAKRRGFLYPSYEVYGGLAGFYDYGPLGAVMKKRFEDLWRMVWHNSDVPALEIRCPRVTPHQVLKASGHVDEFTDLVVKCAQGHPSRADHLVEGAGFKGNADALEPSAIDELVLSLKAKCPVCNQAGFTAATPMNLMNQTEIGPGSGRVGYMRPETAQGIFTDFPHLLRHQRGKLPFAVLQVGGSNRNEISPRQGMLRLREFNMMESEVFFEDTSGPFAPFAKYQNDELVLVPNTGTEPISMKLGEAVKKGVIANEALGYFIGLTNRFLTLAGVDAARLRFRQHLGDEMAHYARDCWDAEFQSVRYGWVECVGIADRGCYDLTQHAKHSGKVTKHPITGEEGTIPNQEFTISVAMKPLKVTGSRIVPNLGLLGKVLRGDAKLVQQELGDQFLGLFVAAGCKDAVWPMGLDNYEIAADVTSTIGDKPLKINADGKEFELPAGSYQVDSGSWTVNARKTNASVIEPSFGVDRILYAIWEHSLELGEKNGESYIRFRLSPHVAPIQVAVLPLTNQEDLLGLASEIERTLRRSGVLTDYDTSGNIGRRYARQDEVGTPFCITADPGSLEDGAVTIRSRDSGDQERVPIFGIMDYLGRKFQLTL